MANKRVRLVRNVKLDGKASFVAPVVTPAGVTSSEMVQYKGRKLRVPSTDGHWYIRWNEGRRAKWQRCDSMMEANERRRHKQFELQAVSVGIDVKPQDPSRLRLAVGAPRLH
jgi:hypothetical protein